MRIILFVVSLAVSTKASQLGYDGTSQRNTGGLEVPFRGETGGGRTPGIGMNENRSFNIGSRPGFPRSGNVNHLNNSPFRQGFDLTQQGSTRSQSIPSTGGGNDGTGYRSAVNQPRSGNTDFRGNSPASNFNSGTGISPARTTFSSNSPSRGIHSSNTNSRGPSGSSAITLVDQRDGPHADGSYNFAFQTSDGIQRQERGRPTSSGAVAQEGGYSITYPDGTVGEFKFVADENGFRVESPLLPTPPPLPAHAVQQIEKARREDSQNKNNNQRGFQSQNTASQGKFETQKGIAHENYGSNALGGQDEFRSPTDNRQRPSVSQVGNNQGYSINLNGNNQGNMGTQIGGRPSGAQPTNNHNGLNLQLRSNTAGFESSPSRHQGSFGSQTGTFPNSFRAPNDRAQIALRSQNSLNQQSGLSQSANNHGHFQQGGGNSIFESKASINPVGLASQTNNNVVQFGSQIGSNQGSQKSNNQVRFGSQQRSNANQGIGPQQAGIRSRTGSSHSAFGSQSDIRQVQRGSNQDGLRSQQNRNTHQGVGAQRGNNQGRFESQKGGIRTQPGNSLNKFGSQSDRRQHQRGSNQGELGSHHNRHTNQVIGSQHGHSQGSLGSQQGRIRTQSGNPLDTFGSQSNIRQSQSHNNQGRFGSQQRSNPKQRFEPQNGDKQISFGTQHSGFRSQSQKGNNIVGLGPQRRTNANQRFTSQTGDIQSNSRPQESSGNIIFKSKNNNNQPEI